MLLRTSIAAFTSIPFLPPLSAFPVVRKMGAIIEKGRIFVKTDRDDWCATQEKQKADAAGTTPAAPAPEYLFRKPIRKERMDR